MRTTTDTPHVPGWQQAETPDGYRIVGSQWSAWFVQGPPLMGVVARPPAHLTLSQAVDWFLGRQKERSERV